LSLAGLLRSRLKSLGYEQKQLARAARVTDSYISQLLTQRKAPPSPERTDIYAKMETFLELEPGELGRLAEMERTEEIKRRLAQPPAPLFQEFRDLVLSKCVPKRREEVRAVFERQPFGTLERLVTQTLLESVQRAARKELESEDWVRLAARVGGRSGDEMRVIVLRFLDADVFQVSTESCVAFLDPLLESWDVDLETFSLDIRLNPRLVEVSRRTFAFVETTDGGGGEQPGFAQFLNDARLSAGITEEEARLLRGMRLGGRRPNSLYYYRGLQNLRDPLHFDDGNSHRHNRRV